MTRAPTRRPLPFPASPTTVSLLLLAGLSIAAATAVVAIFEQLTDVPDASAVYLVAVVIVGSVGGTAPAIATALVSFVVYDFLFTSPRFSLVVADTNELLNLVLVLFVALVVGRLAALGRARAAEADRQAAEATGLFAVSRLLATADRTDAVVDGIVARLAADVAVDRVWIGLERGGREQVLADTGTGPPPTPASVLTLVRMPGDEPARWVRAHEPSSRPDAGRRPATESQVFRIRIEAEGTTFGSLWSLRPRSLGELDPSATRLLSLAADQIALGLRRDRLRQDAMTAEVARRSDALKGALLDSVSHDMRTPLASIRATAGNLADPAVDWTPEAIRSAAGSIDVETQRLDRFVRSILDLSRIEAGALRPDLEVFDARELVDGAVSRLRPSLGRRPTEILVAADVPLVRVDAVLFDAALSNVLANIADHTPPDAPVAVRIERSAPGHVLITVEDGGAGVPEDDLSSVFEKFQRSPSGTSGARRGMGIGLSIVQGMVEAMGGTVSARRSALGGLAIDIRVDAAPEPPSDRSSDDGDGGALP